MPTLTFTLRFAAAKNLYILQAHDGAQWSTPAVCLDPRDVDELLADAQRILEPGNLTPDATHLGNRLFRFAFQEPVSSLYYKARGRAEHTNAPLDLRIAIDGVEELHALPWELLHDGQQFLALDGATQISRLHDTNTLGRSLPVEGPVRILLTSASPADAPPLDPTAEEAAVRVALAPLGNRVELVVLHNLAFSTLRHQLARQERNGQPFHIWHHLGHSRRTTDANGRPVFGLTFDDHGHSYDEPISSIATLARSCSSLRGILLAVCRGADASGLAPVLASLGLPLVVGFRGVVDQEITRVFAEEFYTVLAVSNVDKATAEARQLIATEFPQSLAWATPLIFLASHERYLWPPSTPTAIPPALSAPEAAVQLPSGLKIGKVKTRDFEYIGSLTIGPSDNLPPPPALTAIEIDDIEAESTRVINAMAARGDQLGYLSELREIVRNLGGNK